MNLTLSANVYNNIEKIAQTTDNYNKKIVENKLNRQITEHENIKFNPIPSIGLIIDQEGYNIDIKLSDMRSLPFNDESFDAVFSFHVIYHTDSKGIIKVISEIYRVLKPNGEVFLNFNSKNNPNYIRNINNKIGENTIIKQSRC